MPKKIPLSRKSIILITLLTFVVLGGIWFFLYKKNLSNESKPDQTGQVQKYPGPTQQEKDETEQFKQNQQNSSAQPTNQTKTIIPVITYAGQAGNKVTVNGYVSGAFEDGGTCTAKFDKGSSEVTGTSAGFQNVKTTTCPPIELALDKFSQSGTWQLIFSYSSPSGNGSASAVNVEISK